MKHIAGDFSTDCHGWAELLPESAPNQSLIGAHRVPWTVVGAGLTGLACARRLARLHPEQEILLLEARCVAQGASGRNSGFVVATSQFNGGYESGQLDHYRRINRINQFGLDLLSAEVADTQIDCQWRRDGFYHTAADQVAMTECGSFQRYLEALEVDHQLLDDATLHSLLGTGLYKAGIHIADGALVQPAALVRGLAQSLPANVSLYEQSPVLNITTAKPLTLQLADAEVNRPFRGLACKRDDVAHESSCSVPAGGKGDRLLYQPSTTTNKRDLTADFRRLSQIRIRTFHRRDAEYAKGRIFAQSGDDDWAKGFCLNADKFLFVVVSRQTKKDRTSAISASLR
jgi:hypothetical protein